MSEESAGLAQAAIDAGVAPNGNARPGSFEARMQERRERREQRTTEIFDVPGFEDLFKVELQVVGFRPMSDIQLRHQRVAHEGMRALAIAAETLVEATVAFHMVQPDGTTAEAEGYPSWLDLAHAYDPSLGADTHERVAMIRLLEGNAVIALFGRWNDWNTRGNETVNKELAEDFGTT